MEMTFFSWSRGSVPANLLLSWGKERGKKIIFQLEVFVFKGIKRKSLELLKLDSYKTPIASS